MPLNDFYQLTMPDSPTVLLACEMGGGLGHVGPLLRLAHALAGLGYRPVFAVRNLVVTWQRLRAERFPVLQAPVWFNMRRDERFRKAGGSFADVLTSSGYESPDHILPLVQGWQDLLDLVRPGLVIADFSPTLCLTTYRSLPTLQIGFGFIVPPTSQPTFPPLIAGRPPVLPDEQLLSAVQEVQRRRGRPVPETLPAMLADAEPFLTVLPELDHYRNVRTEGHLGPLEELLPPQPPANPPQFFAYLSAEFPGTEPILTALASSGFPGQTFIRDAAPVLRERARRLGLEVFESPPPLNEVLPRVGVIVHHGGISVAQHALAAGRPQFVFPMHFEQSVTARHLHELGVSHYIMGPVQPPDVISGIRQLLMDGVFQQRARALAEDIHARGPWDPLPKILERCREILAKG